MFVKTCIWVEEVGAWALDQASTPKTVDLWDLWGHVRLQRRTPRSDAWGRCWLDRTAYDRPVPQNGRCGDTTRRAHGVSTSLLGVCQGLVEGPCWLVQRGLLPVRGRSRWTYHPSGELLFSGILNWRTAWLNSIGKKLQIHQCSGRLTDKVAWCLCCCMWMIRLWLVQGRRLMLLWNNLVPVTLWRKLGGRKEPSQDRLTFLGEWFVVGRLVILFVWVLTVHILMRLKRPLDWKFLWVGKFQTWPSLWRKSQVRCLRGRRQRSTVRCLESCLGWHWLFPPSCVALPGCPVINPNRLDVWLAKIERPSKWHQRLPWGFESTCWNHFTRPECQQDQQVSAFYFEFWNSWIARHLVPKIRYFQHPSSSIWRILQHRTGNVLCLNIYMNGRFKKALLPPYFAPSKVHSPNSRLGFQRRNHHESCAGPLAILLGRKSALGSL